MFIENCLLGKKMLQTERLAQRFQSMSISRNMEIESVAQHGPDLVWSTNVLEEGPLVCPIRWNTRAAKGSSSNPLRDELLHEENGVGECDEPNPAPLQVIPASHSPPTREDRSCSPFGSLLVPIPTTPYLPFTPQSQQLAVHPEVMALQQLVATLSAARSLRIPPLPINVVDAWCRSVAHGAPAVLFEHRKSPHRRFIVLNCFVLGSGIQSIILCYNYQGSSSVAFNKQASLLNCVMQGPQSSPVWTPWFKLHEWVLKGPVANCLRVTRVELEPHFCIALRFSSCSQRTVPTEIGLAFYQSEVFHDWCTVLSFLCHINVGFL